MTEVEKCFVVRCRYVANAGQPAGVGYLDRDSHCTRDVHHAQTFATEDDAWTFAAVSGEQVPEDAWAEEHPKDDRLKRLRVFSPEEHGVLDYNKLPIQTLDIDMRNPPAPLQEEVEHMERVILAGLGVTKEDVEKYGPSTMRRADLDLKPGKKEP